jgi:hypothetical protein
MAHHRRSDPLCLLACYVALLWQVDLAPTHFVHCLGHGVNRSGQLMSRAARVVDVDAVRPDRELARGRVIATAPELTGSFDSVNAMAGPGALLVATYASGVLVKVNEDVTRTNGAWDGFLKPADGRTEGLPHHGLKVSDGVLLHLRRDQHLPQRDRKLACVDLPGWVLAGSNAFSTQIEGPYPPLALRHRDRIRVVGRGPELLLGNLTHSDILPERRVVAGTFPHLPMLSTRWLREHTRSDPRPRSSSGARRSTPAFLPMRPRTLVDRGMEWDTAGRRQGRNKREYQHVRRPAMQVERRAWDSNPRVRGYRPSGFQGCGQSR